MDFKTPTLVRDEKQYVGVGGYSPQYRFRLWRACKDDKQRLGIKGDRSYLAHVIRTLTALEDRHGYSFENSHGGPIDFDDLKYEDLYNFLGRQKNKPTGPETTLTLPKFWVLDAYFHAYYPTIARAFSSDNELAALAAVSSIFFANPRLERFAADKLAAVEGAYVCAEDDYRTKFSSIDRESVHADLFRIPAIFLHHPPERNFLQVAIVNLSPSDKFFDTNSAFWRQYRRGKSAAADANFLLPEDTVIHQGIAFPVVDPDEIGENLELACIMKDRVLSTPMVVTMNVGMPFLDMSRAVEFNAHSLTYDGGLFVRPRMLEQLLSSMHREDGFSGIDAVVEENEVNGQSDIKKLSFSRTLPTDNSQDIEIIKEKKLFTEEFFQEIYLLYNKISEELL